MQTTKCYDEKTQRAVLECMRRGFNWIAYYSGNYGLPVKGKALPVEKVGEVAAAFGELCTWLAYGHHTHDSVDVEQQLRIINKILEGTGVDNVLSPYLAELIDTLRAFEAYPGTNTTNRSFTPVGYAQQRSDNADVRFEDASRGCRVSK